MSTPEPGPAPDDSLEPFPTATVSEAEVSIRRAPKVPVFLVLGGLIGGIVSAAITSAFPIDEKVGYAATVGYFLLYGIPIGIVLGALLALILGPRLAAPGAHDRGRAGDRRPAPLRRRTGAAAQLSCVRSTQARYSGVTVPVTYSPVKQLISSDSTFEPCRMAASMSATSW